MKRITLNGPYQVGFEESPTPRPGSGELVVRTVLSGISTGTEMMLYRGTFPNLSLKKWAQWKEYPVYPGYELVGIVEEVGPQPTVRGGNSMVGSLGPAGGTLHGSVTEFSPGDRVVCLGEHAGYVRVPAGLTAKLPDSVDSMDASLIPLACTAMHSVRRAQIQYCDTVTIVGAGVVGLLVLQHARAAGAGRTIVVDVRKERLAIAREYGADLVVDASEADPVSPILDFTRIGSDVVVEASGSLDSVKLACDLVRDRGRIVLVGWHERDVSFVFGDLYFKEVEIVASRAIGPEPGLPYAHTRWTADQNLRYAVELMSRSVISGRHMRPTVFPWHEAPNVYSMLDRQDGCIPLRAALDWTHPG